MRPQSVTRPAAGLAVLAAALLLLPGAALAAKTGIVCTTSQSATFTLRAQPGYVSLPDGNTMYMWSLAPDGADFQHPGPVLCVTEGDTVTVILRNDLTEPTSLVFPGQEGVTADGAPVQPQLDGSGVATSLAQVAAANGGSVTYSFVASRPGSFIYESGTAPWKQVRMGLFGALVVRPADFPPGQPRAPRPDFANDRADSRFTPTEEFMVLLSEIDPYQHQAVEAGGRFNMTRYHPRYWLINGRGFPDSVADNLTPWLPAQPYGALARVHPTNENLADTLNYHPSPGLIRYLNVGSELFPFHPHGNNGLVIGRDGHPLEGPAGQDQSFEKFAIDIGPGQTWDVAFRWRDAEGYDEATNPVPVTTSNIANLTFGMFYSGSPYLGVMGPMPPGTSTLNECGEYYVISHNHALYQITSWGMTMSGPITYLRVDPPFPNTCSSFP